MTELESQIQTVINNIPDIGRVVFFVGAGLSVSAGYPLWSDASKEALDLAKAKGLGGGALAYAAEKVDKGAYYDFYGILKHELPEACYLEIAVKVFGGSNSASDLQRRLIRVPSRGVITTNFDECLTSACVLERSGPPLSDIRYAMAADEFFVIKPHGSILNPRTMVLNTTDWMRLLAEGDFRDFIAHTVSNHQFLFLGYSLRDPDFQHVWDDVLRQRTFRASALYCCAKGALEAERIEELRGKNVQVIQFEDDGSYNFLTELVTKLGESRAPLPSAAATSPPIAVREAAQELERYVLLCLQFSPEQESRLVLVCKAVVLERIASLNLLSMRRDEIINHVCKTLGQDSELIRGATETAIAQLSAAQIVEADLQSISIEQATLVKLKSQVDQADIAEQDWVGRVLSEQAKDLNADLQGSETQHVTKLLDQVLMAVGNEVAQLLLFNRPPKGEINRVDEIVDAYCASNKVSVSPTVYRKTLKRLLFDPAEGEEDLLFKRLQAYFISSAYILDPTSEKLLSEYARNHWVYLDASVALPALAAGHPANEVYKKLLRSTYTLGMKLKVTKEMLNEIEANVKTARRAFGEFARTQVDLQEVLEGYVALNGTGNGNVFLEGYLDRLHLDPSLTPDSYLAMIFGSRGTINEGMIMSALAEMYHVEQDDIAQSEGNAQELAEITTSIEHLRKQGGRFKTRLLCEHEAKQFFLIHLRRKQHPALVNKIWFVTTDHFITELQRLERNRYPLPMSYTPRAWFQYIQLVDTDARGSEHFSRLQPKMRFGVVTGELGIEAIRTILLDQKKLIEKGVVTVKELAEAAVREYHVRQSIADYDRTVGSRRELDRSDAKGRIRTEMGKAINQFVAVRTQELDRLKEERANLRDESKNLRKQLDKQKYIVRTLKAQSRPRKRKRR